MGHLYTLLQRYIENYLSPNGDSIKPLHFETKHRMYLGQVNGTAVYYQGRLDMLEESRIVETKSTSYLGGSFLDRTKPNDQATGYCVLASDKLGKPIRNCLFNGISTSGYGLKSEPAKWPINKTPADLFLRAETFRTDEDIESWKTRALVSCDRLVSDLTLWLNNRALAEDTIEQNAPDACTMFNTTCPYIELCRSQKVNRETIMTNTLNTEPWESFSYTVESK
jgi:hypothetical protein